MTEKSGMWSRQWVRALRQPATVLGLAMILACWLGVGYVLSIGHSKLESNAAQQGDNLAHLFEENITNTFKGIDRTLMVLREAYERDPGGFDCASGRREAPSSAILPCR